MANEQLDKIVSQSNVGKNYSSALKYDKSGPNFTDAKKLEMSIDDSKDSSKKKRPKR